MCALRVIGAAVAIFLSMAATPALAAITGTVRDRETNAPLSSKVAQAYSASGFLQATSTTNSQGGYTLNVPAGSYRVLAFDQEGLFATTFASNAESFETSPLVSSDAVVDFTLTRGGFATGQVVTDGAALFNATVEAYNLSGTRRGFTLSDSSGNFRLVLPPGEYKLVAYQGTVFAPEFFSGRTSFGEADVVRINAGQTVGAGFGLERAATFSGFVTDSAGLALAGKMVFAYSAEGAFVGSTTTDASGAFSLALSPAGYRFVAADPNQDLANAFLEGAQSFDRSPVITLLSGQTRTGQFILQPGGRISGRAIQSGSGLALIGATIAAYNLDGTIRSTTKTDDTGFYTLTLPEGQFVIAAFDERLIFASEFYDNRRQFLQANPVTIIPRTNVSLMDIVMDRGTQVGGVVTDAGGARVGGVIVGAYDVDGNLITSTTTSAQGEYALVVVPGTYRFLAADPQLRYAIAFTGGATSFETAPLQTIQSGVFEIINFTVTTGIRVSGTVRDAAGRGISDVEIIALDPNGNRVATARSVEGTFSLALAPGAYKFLALDLSGRFRSVFFRGADLGSAETVTVSASNQPVISFTLTGFQRRRAARH